MYHFKMSPHAGMNLLKKVQGLSSSPELHLLQSLELDHLEDREQARMKKQLCTLQIWVTNSSGPAVVWCGSVHLRCRINLQLELLKCPAELPVNGTP
jgi:hypothetical protein